MGRYLLYRMPWSVGELLRPEVPSQPIQLPAAIDQEEWQALCDFLVVREHKPWFLVEVKQSGTALSPALGHFQA